VEAAKSSSRRRQGFLRYFSCYNPVFNVVIRLCNHFAGMNM
jgi:hypothetical protein